MAKNQHFWKKYLSTSEDVNLESQEEKDALEEGLESLSWFENSKRAVKRTFGKPHDSLGEVIGNSVTHGVMAAFFLGMIPYAAIRSYTHAPEGMEVLDSVGIAFYMIGTFLMFLVSTLYHTSKNGSTHKYVTSKIDHVMVYLAIACTYTPVWLCLIGGGLGLGMCIAQWSVALACVFLKLFVFTFTKSKLSRFISTVICLLLGWIIVVCAGKFYAAATAPCFWLILAGGICYTVGIVFNIGKYKFSHMIWHLLVDAGAICHFIGLVYFFR